VGARDQDRPDLRRGEPLQLRGDALDGAARLGVGVEEIARDQDDVDLLGEGNVDRGLEGGELAFSLGRRLIPEVGVAGAEVHVSGVEESEHPVGLASCAVAAWATRRDGAPGTGTVLHPGDPAPSEAAPDCSPAASTVRGIVPDDRVVAACGPFGRGHPVVARESVRQPPLLPDRQGIVARLAGRTTPEARPGRRSGRPGPCNARSGRSVYGRAIDPSRAPQTGTP
jgi:hypothetical protein